MKIFKVTEENRIISWFYNDKLHKEDGPAVYGPNICEYYLEGIKYSKEEWYQKLNPQDFTINPIMLAHTQTVECANELIEVFDNIKSFTELIKRISNVSEKTFPVSNNDKNNDKRQKLKGDLFEIFAELFFKYYENDLLIGKHNYSPSPPEDDFGVDAIGVNHLGYNIPIQIKFRNSDPKKDKITFKELSRTYTDACHNHKMFISNKSKIVVFTSGPGLCHTVDKGMHNIVESIGKSMIQRYTKSPRFWSYCYKSVRYTLDTKSKITPETETSDFNGWDYINEHK